MEPELLSSAGETTAFTLEGWMSSTAQRQLFRVVAGRWESNSHPYKPPLPTLQTQHLSPPMLGDLC